MLDGGLVVLFDVDNTPLDNDRFGRPVILSDKEKSLDHVQKRHPAAHYVVVDDKPALLASMKRLLGEKLTTIFVRQGHFALDAGAEAVRPVPDRVIERIGDLTTLDAAAFGARS